MGPVVCAVDDSDAARAALRVARDLARGLGRRLLVVHAEPPTEAPGVSAAPAGQERLRAAELADAEALLERLAREEGLDEDVELRSEVGPAADRILRVCEEEDASLVVVGSRGRGDLRAAVLGSVSHAVAGRAPCPAVTVSPEAVARVLAAT
jgi:nucleotide-binding universal stress UspA family protein